MSKITIIDGNSNDKDNVRAIMVKGEKGDKGDTGDPTKLSQLENDVGYITVEEANLENYYTKSEIDATVDDLNATIDEKADTTEIESEISDINSTLISINTTLGQKANTSDVSSNYATKTELSTSVGSEASSRQSADSTLETKINTEKARIDNLSALTEGSTTGDAELTDIRIAYDGATSSTAGNSVRNQVNILKDRINTINAQEEITFTYKSKIEFGSVDVGSTVDLTPTTLNNFKCAVVNCSYGDKFILNGRGGNNPRLWGFVDSSNKLLSKSNSNVTVENYLLIAPENASKLIINNDTSYNVVPSFKLRSRIDIMEENLNDLSDIPFLEIETRGKTYTIPKSVNAQYRKNIKLYPSYSYIVYNNTNNSITCNLFDENGAEVQKLGGISTGTTKTFKPTTTIAKVEGSGVGSGNVVIKSVYKTLDDKMDYVYGKDLSSQLQAGNITTAGNIGDTIDLTVQSINNYLCAVITCTPNQYFYIKGCGGNNPRLWAFLDSNNKLLSEAPASYNAVTESVIKSPLNTAKLVINFNTLYEYEILSGNDNIHILEDKINNLDIGNHDFAKDDLLQIPEDDFASLVRGTKLSSQLQTPLTDFKKNGDLMVHVSTFVIIDGMVYVTYYANRTSATETPSEHIARFVYAPLNNLSNKTYIDLQSVGDVFDGKTVTAIYDTILMRKDDNTLYLMWTASMDGTYYRLYKTFSISDSILSETQVNYFKVGSTSLEFNGTNMTTLLDNNNIEHETITGDIGLMQKLSSYVDNGTTYYYTGCYATKFGCIVRSTDLITWEYVSQPTFKHNGRWENAVYVKGNYAYYFCRQEPEDNTGFLTRYSLINGTWENPIFVNDCQSRSTFFELYNVLYLVHAPKDRDHIAIMKINTTYLNKSFEHQIAKVPDYFYPYVDNYGNDLYMSFTQSRQHIYLSQFQLNQPSNDTILNKLYDLFYN